METAKAGVARLPGCGRFESRSVRLARLLMKNDGWAGRSLWCWAALHCTWHGAAKIKLRVVWVSWLTGRLVGLAAGLKVDGADWTG